MAQQAMQAIDGDAGFVRGIAPRTTGDALESPARQAYEILR